MQKIRLCTFLPLLLLGVAFLLLPSRAYAASGINQEINFQGKVVNKTAGTNVSDGSYSFTFSIYSVSSGGVAIWTETKNITVTNGIFQTLLGDTTSLPGSIDFNSDTLYLGVDFNSDGEMSPRIQFAAVPYAFNAKTVSGLTVTNTTGTLTIPNSKTISFADAFTTSGANSLTLTTTAATNVTLPTTGTLATLAGTETFTNKTIGSTGLVFSGATTDITTATNEGLTLAAAGTGDITLSPGGSNVIFSDGSVLNVGGAGAQAYNFFADSTAGNSTASSDNDLYIQDKLEVDGTATFNGAMVNSVSSTETVTFTTTGGDFEYFVINGTSSSSEGFTASKVNLTANGTGTAYGLQINSSLGASGVVGGVIDLNNADTANNKSPSNFINISDLETAPGATPTGIKFNVAGSMLAIDASDPEITTALSFGANDIVGTTGNIDLSNFDVTGSSGNITTAGDLAVNGGDITSTGSLTVTSGGSGDIVLSPASGRGVLINTTTSQSATNNLLVVRKDQAAATRIELNNANASGFTNIRYYQDTTITANTYFDNAQNLFVIDAANAGSQMTFEIADSEVARFDNNGRLGIGDNSPAAALTVGSGDLFQVDGSTGSITTAGDIAINGGDVTSTGALTIQAAGSGTTSVVHIGAGGTGSTTPDFLALDVKSTTGDPAGGAEGYMYYNTFDNKFRCYQGAAWTDCAGGGGGFTSFDVDGDNNSPQTITDGNEFLIAGGTNGIDTVASATDTVTLNLDYTEIGDATFGSGGAVYTWTINTNSSSDVAFDFSDGNLGINQNVTVVGSVSGSSLIGNSLDRSSAGALAVGNVTATSVSICNSAACDTISIGTNADADTISIGDSSDGLTIASSTFNVASGAVSGVTTLGSSGDWTWTATTPSITINAGEVWTLGNGAGSDNISFDLTNNFFRVGDASNGFTFDVDSGPSYAGTARPARKVVLSPEYPGAVLTADGSSNSGTMTSDFCEKGATTDITDTNTTICSTNGDMHNYYSWTTSQASAQDYDIWIRWRVPDNFAAWDTNPVQVYGKRFDTTNNAVTVYVYDTAGTLNNAGGTQVAGTSWTQTAVSLSGGTWTAGSYMTIRVVLNADTGGDSVQAGEINLNYLSNN